MLLLLLLWIISGLSDCDVVDLQYNTKIQVKHYIPTAYLNSLKCQPSPPPDPHGARLTS